jgi:hypothetical protein
MRTAIYAADLNGYQYTLNISIDAYIRGNKINETGAGHSTARAWGKHNATLVDHRRESTTNEYTGGH